MAIESARGHADGMSVERRAHSQPGTNQTGKPGVFDVPEERAADQGPVHRTVPARGIVIGVLVSAVIWAGIALLVF